MSFTVMLWLVNPGEQFHEGDAVAHSSGEARSIHPGAKSGVNEPPAFTRLVYGAFDRVEDAEEALEEIERCLTESRPLRVEMSNARVFLIPAARVHYAVIDRLEGNRA